MEKLFTICHLRFGIGLLLVLLAAPSARAQGTPGTGRCPAQADTLDSLFRLKDRASGVLSGALTPSSTTITVSGSTAPFPSSGSIKIDDEVIYYTSKTDTQFLGLTRGASDTVAASHANSALVTAPILSAHHNALAQAIICAQTIAMTAVPATSIDTDGTLAANSDSKVASQKATKIYVDDGLATKQPLDSDLTAIAALTPANDDVIQRKSGAWINRTIAQMKLDLGVSNVTNDAQTKAAIVPNTIPTAGQLMAGNAGGTAYSPVTMTGDCSFTSTGAITCTKTNGTSFGSGATAPTSTVGLNLLNLTNPSATRFLQINSDNSVTAQSASTQLNALLPAQSGNAGKYLSTDGTSGTWDTLPLANVVDVTKPPSGLTAVKGDAVVGSDGATNASSTTFSSAAHPCVSGDAGKPIVIYGAGSVSGITGLNNALRTTISSCSGSNFTLAVAATATTSGKRFVYGTENKSAVQAILNSLGPGGTAFIPTIGYMQGSVTVPAGVRIVSAPRTSMIYSTENSVFVTSSHDNITIDGVSIDAAGNPAGNGAVTLIGGTGMNNLLVQNCYLTDTFLTNNLAPVTTFNRHGILARDYTGFVAFNNTLEHSLRIKFAGGSVGESKFAIIYNRLKDTNENGISGLTGQAVTVQDGFIGYNDIEGIAATGNGIVIGDDGGGGSSQKFINIAIVGNHLKGTLPSNTAFIQDKGSGEMRNIVLDYNTCDNRTGTTETTTMCINKANQGGTISNTINFEAIGNVADGVYDYSAFRIGNVGNGVFSSNTVNATNTSTRCLRIGTISNTIFANNNLNNCSVGIDVNNGALSNVLIKDTLMSLAGANSAEGVYVDTQSTATSNFTFDGLNIIGAGGSYTNVYGIEDGNGTASTVTDTIDYLNVYFTNINTTSGLGSRWYQNLPTHARVTEKESINSTTVTTGATPDVRGKRHVTLNYSGSTTVTNFLNGYDRQVLYVRAANGNSTIQNGTNFTLKDASDFAMSTDNEVLLRYQASDSKWHEVARQWATQPLPNPSTSSLGGIQSLAAVSHKWINSISTAGVPNATQPSAGDISGLAPSATTDTTTTANITDSANKRFVTDAQQTVITNTSGTNTGDQFTSTTASRLIGRGSASSGAAQEISLGGNLSMSGTTLSVLTGSPLGWQDTTTRTVAAAQTQYTCLFGCNTPSFNSTESNRTSGFPVNGTISNLYIRTSGTQPNDGANVCTLRDTTGATDSNVVATITANGAAGWYSDTNSAHSMSVTAGNSYTLKCVNASASTSAGIVEVKFLFVRN